jgi:hypothetical protein
LCRAGALAAVLVDDDGPPIIGAIVEQRLLILDGSAASDSPEDVVAECRSLDLRSGTKLAVA